MIYKVLLCIGAHFEMLQLLPTTDSLIHRIFAVIAGEHLKTQMCENCSIRAHIPLTYQNLIKRDAAALGTWRTVKSSQWAFGISQGLQT